MSSREEEFLAKLRATFQIEAADHLRAITAGLLELEKNPSPDGRQRWVSQVFRAAHSLKGAARAVGLIEIETICQSLEDVFDGWMHGRVVPKQTVFDALHRQIDAIHGAMPAPARPVSPPRSTPEPAPAAPSEKPVAPETVRISTAMLDAQLLEAEELLGAKLTVAQRARDLNELHEWFDSWLREWNRVHVGVQLLRQSAPDTGEATASGLLGLLDFTDWSFDRVKMLQARVTALTRTARHDQHAIGRLVDELLENAKKLLMLPFSTIAVLLPRLVRDLSRDQDKEARLVLEGEDTALDKRILEEMTDPLVHLLRNCVDHGVEPPARRTALGKRATATITVSCRPIEANKVELVVSDDGGGIDLARVKESAVARGRLSEEDARGLDEVASLELVFRPEISASPAVTRVSGRGLGLAIVREKVENLGGTVAVESRFGVGTTFRVVLPVTLATARGVTVEVANRTFVVPSLHVERVARVKREDVRTVEGRETIALGDRAIALVHLAEVLELPPSPDTASANAAISILVLGAAEQRVAFAVDNVLGEQEVLVKPLRKPLSRVRNIAGATVLGSGQVVPILNVADLLKSARRSDRSNRAPLRAATDRAASRARSILVVEDSITSRMLLKGILESAGYAVKTAVDGIDAYTLLRTEPFDLVVSDVEMPRLNGFELTRMIRADKRIAELPLILVTALETAEDRERGIDVGANAYVVKSSFDQSDLLEAVRRLI